MMPRYSDAGSSAYKTRSYPGTAFSTMFTPWTSLLLGSTTNVSVSQRWSYTMLLYMRIPGAPVHRFGVFVFCLLFSLSFSHAPQHPVPNTLGGMRWRMIGPFR